MNDIKILFVREEGCTPSEGMLEAFKTCQEILETTTWVDENQIDPSKLTKTEYLIFENFSNHDFKQFEQSKCPILGPLAIMTCLRESKSVPNYPWPIFNVAMYNCVVVCSGLSRPEKNKLKEKVQLMGGLVTDLCTTKNTHLVSNLINSDKYTFAGENGIKIMSVSWVEKIWELSQTTHIDATRPDIIDNYKLPCLHNLVICTTGITDSQVKRKLARIIAENGGELVNKLKVCSTDILICHGEDGMKSEKFKAASKGDKMPCVSIDWVYDSVSRGFALPPKTYKVNRGKSTPEKGEEKLDPNFSMMSIIAAGNGTRRSEIDASIDGTRNINSTLASNSNKRKASSGLIDKLDLKKVKIAGQFLDGCSIYLAGFNPEEHEKLNKVINLSGATRYSEISDRVTHVICGDNTCQEIANIRNMRLPCALVSLQWLLDSVSKQYAVREDAYLLGATEVTLPLDGTVSPLRQKALSMCLLKTNSMVTENDMDSTTVAEPEPEPEPDDVLQRYAKQTTDITESEDTLAALLKDNPNPTLNNVSENREQEEFKIRTKTLIRASSKVCNDSFEGQFKPNDTSTQIRQAQNQPEISTQMSEVSSEMPTTENMVLRNLTFVIVGFDEENYQYVHDAIDELGGQVVKNNFKGIPNYAILPAFGNIKLTQTVEEIVNEQWITECLAQMVLCDINYYHRPLSVPDTKPLENCVITTTNYTGPERQFLHNLAVALGGIAQEQFSKRKMEKRGILSSTHLICPEPTGKKYEAAIKWNIPVVTRDWLLECARTGLKVSENNFLVEGSVVPNDSESNTNSSSTIRKGDNTANNLSVQEENGNNENGNKLSAKFVEEPKKVSIRSAETPLVPERKMLSREAVSEPSTTTINDPKTPINQRFNLAARETPETYSQITPVNKILQDAIDNNLIQRNVDTNTPKVYYPWDPKTPETPLGLFITPNPSRSLRKEMQRFIDSIPDFEPPKRRLSTPLSELRSRLMDKIYCRGEFAQSSEIPDAPVSSGSSYNQETSEKISELEKKSTGRDDVVFLEKNKESEGLLDTKLQKFQEMLKASGSGSGVRKSMNFESTTSLLGVVEAKNDIQSQICTVGWDYGDLEPKEKVFMISGVDAAAREKITQQLETLGAKVVDSGIYEECATHLICQKPSRSEKPLACMAAGKWILHLSYVEKSMQAGKFVDEELYEFGNPKSKNIVHWDPRDILNSSIYHWRLHARETGTAAFSSMRAIVVAGGGRESLVRVIQAGGGVIVNVKPPYHDTVNATHCLLESKTIKDYKIYIPLAKQGIKCLNTIYVDHFLRRTQYDIKELYIPELAKYHS